ncbi:MAG: DUF4252 domain-containing protein [Bacteroidota bacterium]
MKKFVITTLLALAPFFTFAQSAFDKFTDVEGIETISVSGKMFDMLGGLKIDSLGDKGAKVKDQLKNIESLKVFTTSDKKHKKNLRAAAADYLKDNKMEELMSINDKGSKIKLYIKQGASETIIKEGLVFIDDAEGKELVLVAFKGNIDLKSLEGIK